MALTHGDLDIRLARFDLDPGEGLTTARSANCIPVEDLLERIGLEVTRRLPAHEAARLRAVGAGSDYGEAAAFAERVATLVAKEKPVIATVERS